MGTYLGQNFLIDAKVRHYIADKILSLYKELGCEALIEIGPGKGSITKLIQHISPNFFVVDKDPTFRDNGQLILEHGEFILSDILELDVEALLKEKGLDSKKTLIVGNLPYYITSPILRKFFGSGNQHFAGGIFMVQDEVGQRLESSTKKKSYLWWLLNYAYMVTYLKGVPAKCFKPAPKVKSCLIQLTTTGEQLPIDRDRFVEFLELFAPFSRKTLGAIQTMINKRSAIKAPVGRDKMIKVRCTHDKDHDKEIKTSVGCNETIHIEIPESLKKKRLEELPWEDMTTICS